MKVSVRPGRCRGYGYCADLAPEVYTLDASGYNDLVDQPAREVPAGLEAEAIEGLHACPLSALTADEAEAEHPDAKRSKPLP